MAMKENQPMVDELHALRERIGRVEKSAPSPPVRRDPVELPPNAVVEAILGIAVVAFVVYLAMLVVFAIVRTVL